MASQKSTQELLKKYWAAETTPEEEAQLRTAFENSDKDVYAGYFQFLQAESSREMRSPVTPVKHPVRLNLRRTLSIAAAVLVLITAGFLIQRSMISDMHITTANTDSYTDPRQAYEETKQALLMVSQKLNTSREIAEEQFAKTRPYVEIIK